MSIYFLVWYIEIQHWIEYLKNFKRLFSVWHISNLHMSYLTCCLHIDESYGNILAFWNWNEIPFYLAPSFILLSQFPPLFTSLSLYSKAEWKKYLPTSSVKFSNSCVCYPIERIREDRPITIKDDRGNSSKLIAEIVALFITAMDKLKLEYRSMDDLHGDLKVKHFSFLYTHSSPNWESA